MLTATFALALTLVLLTMALAARRHAADTGSMSRQWVEAHAAQRASST